MTKTILIIEDEPYIIEAISFLLEREGWNVVSHSDGGTAFNRVHSLEPDLVILDVMLPNKSGFDILRELRASTDTARIPVLILTAKGQAKDRETAQNLGASQFLSKPFSNQEILEQVKQLVQA